MESIESLEACKSQVKTMERLKQKTLSGRWDRSRSMHGMLRLRRRCGRDTSYRRTRRAAKGRAINGFVRTIIEGGIPT